MTLYFMTFIFSCEATLYPHLCVCVCPSVLSFPKHLYTHICVCVCLSVLSFLKHLYTYICVCVCLSVLSFLNETRLKSEVSSFYSPLQKMLGSKQKLCPSFVHIFSVQTIFSPKFFVILVKFFLIQNKFLVQ